MAKQTKGEFSGIENIMDSSSGVTNNTSFIRHTWMVWLGYVRLSCSWLDHIRFS